MRHQLHPDWPNRYFASEMRKKLNRVQLFFAEKFIHRERNFSAYEQTVFCEKYFAFCKDFSQWKSGLYHIISYHIISHHIISYHIISYHIISYHIISYHIISYHIISYHIISYHIISYHIISYHIISYHYHQLFKHGSPFNKVGLQGAMHLKYYKRDNYNKSR